MDELMRFVKNKGQNQEDIESIIHTSPIFSDKTESPVYAEKVSNGNAILEYMSPDNYIKKCKKLQCQDGSIDEYVSNTINIELAKKYSKDMAQGNKFPIPIIDFVKGYQEGRHRAVAAKFLGYNSIPVVIVNK
jgi:hypothetical protein